MFLYFDRHKQCKRCSKEKPNMLAWQYLDTCLMYCQAGRQSLKKICRMRHGITSYCYPAVNCHQIAHQIKGRYEDITEVLDIEEEVVVDGARESKVQNV